MAKQRNEPIGTCPCPVKGCDISADVFKYRSAVADDQRPEYRRRFAGLLYLRCTEHGKYDGQEYILNNATIEGAKCQPKNHEKAPVQSDGALVETLEKPASAPVPHQSAPATKAEGMGFGFFRQ